MPQPTLLSLLALVASLSLCPAQVTATFNTFGSGCPGTGIGLGSNHLLPAAANTTWGSGNGIPFGWSPNRYQQVFLGSELPSAFTMGGLALRQTHTGPVAHGFTVDLQIAVGYTTRWLGSLDTTFANNWDAGAPVVVLPRTQVVFPDQLATHPQSFTEMLLTIPWTGAFAWVPQAGRNLLIEITVFGNSAGGGIYGYALDNLGGTLSLWGTPANATVANGGAVRGFGVTMGFVEQTHTAVPVLFSNDMPQIGNQFRVRIGQGAAAALVLLELGFDASQWNGNALPLPLAGYGAPGCTLLIDPLDTSILVTDAAGAANRQYDIPNSFYLLRTNIYNQAFLMEPTVNALGWVTTNAGHGVLGNQ